jgi:ABC-type antimicrobial peptide transport system permease subunit
VEKVSPLLSMQGQITINDVASELVINFADREFFRLDGTSISHGEFYDDSPENEDKIIISSSALLLFNLDAGNAFNHRIRFKIFKNVGEEERASTKRESVEMEKEYRIIGIINEESSNYVYMPYGNAGRFDNEEYDKLKVKVTAEDRLPLVRNAVVEEGYTVSALSDIIEQANQIFKVVQIVLASFGIVALIVSAIGMFNTMTIALLERTQEIGIMKALGATSLDIWNMFLAESVIIGFFGGLGGIIIGFMGGEIFNYGINLLAGALGGQKIDMFYTPVWFVVLIISFSSIVGLLTGFYPARRAAKINCLEALRYK